MKRSHTGCSHAFLASSKKRGILVLSLLLACSIFVNAEGMTHSASEVCVQINEYSVTLQNAINNNWFNSYHSPTPTEGGCSGAHYASEILIVNPDGNVMTLQEAVTNVKLKGGSLEEATTELFIGHSDASEIIFSDEETLQEKISGNKVCEPSTCDELVDSYGYGELNNGCGETLNCVRACESHASSSCYDNDVYWYDSCGDREEIKQDCGETQCPSYDLNTMCWRTDANYQILLKQIYCTNRGCSSGSCYETAGSAKTVEQKTCPSGDYISCPRCVDCPSCSCGCVTPISCGDGICNGNEDCSSCPSDCGSCPSSGKVICTELHRVGLMDDEDYSIDVNYAREHFSDEALKGYRIWGIEVVKGMRNYPDSINVIAPMVEDFMEEVKYRSGKSDFGNEIGAMYLDEAVPLFERIGVLIDDPDWESLFDDDSWIIKQIKLIRKGLFGEENANNKLIRDYFSEEKLANMFYGSLGNKTEPDMEFNEAFLKELEKSVEEIEELVRNSRN